MDYEIFIGKNNKQNDFLISKVANGEDLWFHGLNYPSSHVILKIPNDKKKTSASFSPSMEQYFSSCSLQHTY